jgi:1,4-alpha-glucan branching enzyme
MDKGVFNLVLHAHLPFVRHVEYEEYLEERWLFEAIIETYLPLLEAFENLKRDNIKFYLTMSITPPLAEMLSDELLQNRFLRYLDKLIDLSNKEIERNKDNSKLYELAFFYKERFEKQRSLYLNEYKGNVLNGFKKFLDLGNLEIITCNATHGFLPFMSDKPESISAQISLGKSAYKHYFGIEPSGIWLAENAYYNGVDNFLNENNFVYFFMNSNGVLFGKPKPHYGLYRPICTPEGVFVFARDIESSEQVWSAESGYPGDYYYREFYRDIGYDRETDYIKPYIDPSGVRVFTGIKYYRITGKVDLGQKEYYDYKIAYNTAKKHAKDFVQKKIKQVVKLNKTYGDFNPVITAPFDAELFGHWWFEGPWFIENLFRELNEQNVIKSMKPIDILESFDMVQVVNPTPSSWGSNGYYEVWMNGKVDWIYPHLDEMSSKMISLSNRYDNPNDLERRILNQMARELLLAQSSDWAFLITVGTAVKYSERRTKSHINRFWKLHDMLVNGKIDIKYLESVEKSDNIFSYIDYSIYKTKK